jgi:hypothetical protein
MKKIVCMLCALFLSTLLLPSLAWDGYDYETGDSIEIEKGQLVRSGRDIEVYNYGTGRYETYEVQSVNSDEVEVYDWNTGTYKTFDMD